MAIFDNSKGDMQLWRKDYQDFTDEYDKDDIYILYKNSTDEKGQYRVKMLGIYVQVNLYFDIENGEYVFRDCYIQHAYDESYKKNPLSSDEALEICEDFEDFMYSFYLKLEEVFSEGEEL